MLLSMTGYGEARGQSDSLSLSVEVRRSTTATSRSRSGLPEPYNLLEAEFEKIVRRDIRRGTVQIHLRIERQASAGDYRINTVALRSYLDQLRQLGLAIGDQDLVGPALALAGRVSANRAAAPRTGTTTGRSSRRRSPQALAALQNMRREEGKAMADELIAQRNLIARHLQTIRERSPEVVRIYQERLRERVKTLLAGVDVTIDSSSVLREVAIFAEAERHRRGGGSAGDAPGPVPRSHEGEGRCRVGSSSFCCRRCPARRTRSAPRRTTSESRKEVVAIKHTLEQIRELIQNVE